MASSVDLFSTTGEHAPSLHNRTHARHRFFPALFLSALLLFAFTGCHSSDSSDDAGRDFTLSKDPFPIGGDFKLTDSNGHAFRLKDQKRPMLLFFGYASCPDFCPQTLARIARAYELLGSDAKDLLTVFVSIDPDRDTPDALKTYLTNFTMPAIGLTGQPDSLKAIVKRYGGYYQPTDQKSAAGTIFSHSLFIYLIDRNGDVRFLFHNNDSAEDIAKVVRQLKT